MKKTENKKKNNESKNKLYDFTDIIQFRNGDFRIIDPRENII